MKQEKDKYLYTCRLSVKVFNISLPTGLSTVCPIPQLGLDTSRVTIPTFKLRTGAHELHYSLIYFFKHFKLKNLVHQLKFLNKTKHTIHLFY